MCVVITSLGDSILCRKRPDYTSHFARNLCSAEFCHCSLANFLCNYWFICWLVGLICLFAFSCCYCRLVFLEGAGVEGKLQLLQEIELMKEIGSHKNVLSMLGYWVRSEPIMLILEYVPHGDLLQWLRNKRQQVRNIKIFFDTFKKID